MATPEITEARDKITSRAPQLAPSRPAPRPKAVPRPLLLALTCAALSWLCYFPADCGWLAWVALVPLLALVRSPARPRTLYLSAWLGALLFYWPVLQWMRVADPRMYFTWGFLATYCSLFFPLGLFLVRFLDRRTPLPLVVSVPVVWTALEFFRSTAGTGFSWYLLGHSQHSFLPLIQVSDITGAYGVTSLVAAGNALLYEVLYARRWFRVLVAGEDTPPRWGRLALLGQGLGVLAVLTATVVYGSWRLGQDTLTPGPRVALIQGNLDQRIRNASSVQEDAARTMVNHFLDLSDLAGRYRPDLIVWPETSYPADWIETADGTPSDGSKETARRMASRWQTAVLVGLNATAPGPDGRMRRYNSAVLVDRKGHPQGRYDKMHRVPFGEYVPLRDWLPWMNRFAPYDFDYSVWPGEDFTRFPLPDPATGHRFTFGVLICYEDTDPAVARPYGGGDGRPAADFVLNISNDGWFNGTSEHDQHLAVCRFRAVECRRSVARSVNMGISAVIDSNGRVLQPQTLPAPTPRSGDSRVWVVPMERGHAEELPASRWGEFKKVPGVLLAAIPIDDRPSFYARWGDWLPWVCWGLLAGGLVVGLVWPRSPAAGG
jgi:apolipoprotein N-acyltransferase